MKSAKERRRIYIYGVIAFSLFILVLAYIIVFSPIPLFFKVLFMILVITMTAFLFTITIPEIEALTKQMQNEKRLSHWE